MTLFEPNSTSNYNAFDCFSTCTGNCLNGECLDGDSFNLQFFASFGFLMSIFILIPIFLIVLIILIVLLVKLNRTLLKEKEAFKLSQIPLSKEMVEMHINNSEPDNDKQNEKINA